MELGLRTKMCDSIISSFISFWIKLHIVVKSGYIGVFYFQSQKYPTIVTTILRDGEKGEEWSCCRHCSFNFISFWLNPYLIWSNLLMMKGMKRASLVLFNLWFFLSTLILYIIRSKDWHYGRLKNPRKKKREVFSFCDTGVAKSNRLSGFIWIRY